MDPSQQIPVFRPTWEEFKDFNQFILHIEKMGAHKAGLAKVIPPPEWKPRAAGYNMEVIGEMDIPAPISQVVQGKQGVYQLYNIQKGHMKVKELKRMADSAKHSTPPHFDYEDLDRKYWRNISYFPPIYGADVSGSLTDPEVQEWNINKLGSILDFVEEDYGISIEGVNTAYLYFGMWKSSFAWHTEDMDLYSINYLHFGEPKSWYCVPPEHGARLERLANNFFPGNAKECPAYLRHKMTVISPMVLKHHSIPYLKIVQEAGEFMITFPYAYHAGFNHGFNCAESTNFASPRWVEYGKRAVQCSCRPDVVKISMETFVKRFQPDRYDLWIQGKDIGPHPEMPGRNSAAPHPSREEILCNKNNSDLPASYVEPTRKKAKRHLIHEKLATETADEQIQPVPIKVEQTEVAKVGESSDSSDDESTIDEQTADTLKDIYYKAGVLEPELEDWDKKATEETEEDNWELEEDDGEERPRKALKRPKPCSRPQVKTRKPKIEPQDIQPPPPTPISAPRPVIPKLSSQLTRFKIPKKAPHQDVDEDIKAWDDPSNFLGHSPIKKESFVNEPVHRQVTQSMQSVPLNWESSKPASKANSPSRRKQKCPKSNRSCIDSRDLAANLTNLWAQQRTWTLVKEAEFNLLQSRQEPHCSVCSLLRSPKSQWEQQLPASSRVLVPESLFGAAGGEERNSPLVSCISCRMCVHAKCYGLPGSPVDTNWLCHRCESNDEMAKCCLCQQKGGALKCTSDGRWAHIVCALCFPGVVFEQPALREPIAIGQLSRESVSQLSCTFCSGKAESSGVFYRGMCIPCSGTLFAGKKCPQAFHPVCGLVNGVQFSVSHDGRVTGVCCVNAFQKPIPRRRNQDDLSVGQIVYAKHPDGKYCLADITDNTLMVTYYWVDFSDGSCSKDTYPEDIRNYNCKEDGPPPVGAAVDVLWTDGKRYGGYFRGQVHRKLYSLRFRDGEDTTVTAERKEFYHPDEELPKRVRDQLEKLGILLNSHNHSASNT